MRSHADGDYSNLQKEEGPARVREANSPATMARLAEIECWFDPTSVFRVNKDIPR